MLPLLAAGAGRAVAAGAARVASTIARGATAAAGAAGRAVGTAVQGARTLATNAAAGASRAMAAGAAGAAMMAGGGSRQEELEAPPEQPAQSNLPQTIQIEEPDAEFLPATVEVEPVEVIPADSGEDQSAAEQLLDTLDRIDVNTAQTAAGVERIDESINNIEGDVERVSDQSEDAPLTGPTDTTGDPNADKATGGKKGKDGGGMFSGIMKMLKGFLNKFVLFFAAAGLAIGGIMTGGAGDLFEKLKELFVKLQEALGPVIKVLIETVMPVVFEVFGMLAALFTRIVEILAPIFVKLIETIMPPLMETFTLLADIFGKIIEFLAPVLEVVANVIGTVAVVILEVINGVLKFLMAPGSYIADGLSYLADAGDMILVSIANLINGIIEFVAGIVEKIPFKGGDWADSLRGLKVEFGDRAAARMEQRAGEREQRRRERDGETDEALDQAADEGIEVDLNIPEQDAQRLEESQQETADRAAEQQQGRDANQVDTPTETPDSEPVNPVEEIAKQFVAQGGHVADGLVKIVKDGQAVMATAQDFQGFTNSEVAQAMTALGAKPSPEVLGTFVTDDFEQTNLEADAQSAGRLDASQDQAQQAADQTADAQQSAAGGGNVTAVSAPSVTTNNSRVSTGVIYTGEPSSLGNRERVLPGVAR